MKDRGCFSCAQKLAHKEGDAQREEKPKLLSTQFLHEWVWGLIVCAIVSVYTISDGHSSDHMGFITQQPPN